MCLTILPLIPALFAIFRISKGSRKWRWVRIMWFQIFKMSMRHLNASNRASKLFNILCSPAIKCKLVFVHQFCKDILTSIEFFLIKFLIKIWLKESLYCAPRIKKESMNDHHYLDQTSTTPLLDLPYIYVIEDWATPILEFYFPFYLIHILCILPRTSSVFIILVVVIKQTYFHFSTLFPATFH